MAISERRPYPLLGSSPALWLAAGMEPAEARSNLHSDVAKAQAKIREALEGAAEPYRIPTRDFDNLMEDYADLHVPPRPAP